MSLSWANFLRVTVVSLLVMRFAGPVMCRNCQSIPRRADRIPPAARNGGVETHRLFIWGAFSWWLGIIAIVERGFSRRGLLTAVLAVLAMIACFDLPFEDLLLPPNGDV